MKKLLVAFMILGLIVGCSQDFTKTKAEFVQTTNKHSIIETIVISADGSDQALPPTGARWKGYYVAQVHLKGSLDDAMTFTINSGEGGQIGTTTTTAATTGEFMPFNAATAECRYLTSNPTYTLSGLGSGTLTAKIVLVK